MTAAKTSTFKARRASGGLSRRPDSRTPRKAENGHESTADGHFCHYICDLGPTLELNMGARTVRLNIDNFFSPDDTAAVTAAIAACNAAVRELATI